MSLRADPSRGYRRRTTRRGGSHRRGRQGGGRREQHDAAWLLGATGKERADQIRDDLQDNMMEKACVFRDARTLTEMRAVIPDLRERYRQVRIEDRGSAYNTELVEVIKLGNLLGVADVLVESALARQEGRGARYREDFCKRDDANWLKHTLAFRRDKGVEFKYKPVTITKFELKERGLSH